MYGLNHIIESLFGGDEPQASLSLLQIAARAIVVYIGGLILVRIGKSRLVGRITSVDIILGFILGSLLSRGITGHASVSGTLTASAVLIAAHWICSDLACHSHRFGNLIKGHAVLIIDRGVIHTQNMKHSQLSQDDLIEELRLHGVNRVEDVEQAFKERNGQISVIKRSQPFAETVRYQ